MANLHIQNNHLPHTFRNTNSQPRTCHHPMVSSSTHHPWKTTCYQRLFDRDEQRPQHSTGLILQPRSARLSHCCCRCLRNRHWSQHPCTTDFSQYGARDPDDDQRHNITQRSSNGLTPERGHRSKHWRTGLPRQRRVHCMSAERFTYPVTITPCVRGTAFSSLQIVASSTFS